MDFSILKRAGITQEQFAQVIGVSRLTVNTWTKGRFTPRLKTRNKVRRALELLNEAVNRGALPVPRVDVEGRVRAELKTIADSLVTTEG